ncbi:hypothetical protein [Streptomyces sp. NPDC018610]|uniref:hypothetical protein n=1 Tax=Streptomyces sp. NPDC018610 TaxID=3365049 RepID=UPI00378D2FD1
MSVPSTMTKSPSPRPTGTSRSASATACGPCALIEEPRCRFHTHLGRLILVGCDPAGDAVGADIVRLAGSDGEVRDVDVRGEALDGLVSFSPVLVDQLTDGRPAEVVLQVRGRDEVPESSDVFLPSFILGQLPLPGSRVLV